MGVCPLANLTMLNDNFESRKDSIESDNEPMSSRFGRVADNPVRGVTWVNLNIRISREINPSYPYHVFPIKDPNSL